MGVRATKGGRSEAQLSRTELVALGKRLTNIIHYLRRLAPHASSIAGAAAANGEPGPLLAIEADVAERRARTCSHDLSGGLDEASPPIPQ